MYNEELMEKIIYFDKETINNILQQENKGDFTKITDTQRMRSVAGSAGVEAKTSTTIAIPILARLKIALTGKVEADFLMKHDSTTTITSTEISEFEKIKDKFFQMKDKRVSYIEKSSTAFRALGGMARVAKGGIEGVDVKELKNFMDAYEGYDTFRVCDSIFVRFNSTAFVSNYKRSDLLTTTITMYCIPVGKFSASDFDFQGQVERMGELITGDWNRKKKLADVYPPKILKNEHEDRKISAHEDKKNVTLYDVVYACIAMEDEVIE